MVNHVLDSLKKEQRGTAFLPDWVKNELESIKSGKFTVDDAEVFKTLLGRATAGSQDGNTRYALGLVRRAVDDTPLISTAGKEAQIAATSARSANREWMKVVDDTPALQAIRDGVEPDKFVQTFITGSGNSASVQSVSKLKNLIQDNPEAIVAIKNNIAQTLKKAALGGKPDELARFSSTGFNRTLSSIGDHKLSMFFNP